MIEEMITLYPYLLLKATLSVREDFTQSEAERAIESGFLSFDQSEDSHTHQHPPQRKGSGASANTEHIPTPTVTCRAIPTESAQQLITTVNAPQPQRGLDF